MYACVGYLPIFNPPKCFFHYFTKIYSRQQFVLYGMYVLYGGITCMHSCVMWCVGVVYHIVCAFSILTSLLMLHVCILNAHK